MQRHVGATRVGRVSPFVLTSVKLMIARLNGCMCMSLKVRAFNFHAINFEKLSFINIALSDEGSVACMKICTCKDKQ